MFYTFKQGESAQSDESLFMIIGRAVLSHEVQKTVGIGITSEDGDWWFIETRPSGTVSAFSIMRIEHGGEDAEIRLVYSATDASRKKVASACLKKAKELGVKSAFTHKPADDLVWLEFGLEIKKNRGRGKYERWEIKM